MRFKRAVVARLCPPNKKRRECLVAKKGLKKWFSEDWVDISAPKKGGGFKACGRSSAKKSERGYPKCVPAAKASKMSKSQIDSAVKRKRAKKQGVGGKPTNVSTFAATGGSVKKKTKGYARGGAMKTKGYAKGGAMKTKGAAKGGKNFTPPRRKNTGLFG